MPSDESSSSLNDLKRLSGTLLAQAWNEVIQRIQTDPESITIQDWLEWVTKFCGGHQDLHEEFMVILNWFRANPTYRKFVKVGKDMVPITVPNTPSLSREWVSLFLMYGGRGVAYNVFYLVRDPLLSASFMIQGQRRGDDDSSGRMKFTEAGGD